MDMGRFPHFIRLDPRKDTNPYGAQVTVGIQKPSVAPAATSMDLTHESTPPAADCDALSRQLLDPGKIADV